MASDLRDWLPERAGMEWIYSPQECRWELRRLGAIARHRWGDVAAYLPDHAQLGDPFVPAMAVRWVSPDGREVTDGG